MPCWTALAFKAGRGGERYFAARIDLASFSWATTS